MLKNDLIYCMLVFHIKIYSCNERCGRFQGTHFQIRQIVPVMKTCRNLSIFETLMSSLGMNHKQIMIRLANWQISYPANYHRLLWDIVTSAIVWLYKGCH